jgi:hypothetical protein
LQRKYDKEKMNHVLINNYKDKVKELYDLNENTNKENLKLRVKVKSMVEII